jgi:predicted nucleic acid binding AN1-type Zn finger protein
MSISIPLLLRIIVKSISNNKREARSEKREARSEKISKSYYKKQIILDVISTPDCSGPAGGEIERSVHVYNSSS